MKKIYYFFASALVLGMTACGGGDDNKIEPTPTPTPTPTTDDVEVSISTADIEFKSNVTTEFTSSYKMNIFAKVSTSLTSDDLATGVVATYDGSKWSMSPSIYVNNTKDSYNGKYAFIYAVSPYDASYTKVDAIPVDMSKQVDLMYSGAAVTASPTTPSVKLTMKHALSLLTFNIVPVNYTGSGTLKNIKIDGEYVYNSGTMDASTGKITLGSTGSISASQSKTIEDGGWKSDMPGVWTLPFSTSWSQPFNNTVGEVNVTFTIDNKTYDLTLPEVYVKYGYQYIFRLALTNNGLEFDPSKTETRSLNVLTDETPEFLGYGKVELTASGSWLNTPSFTGDAVFGTITTPNQTISYSSAVKVEGLSSGNTVVAESWNSTGFEIETLDGIDTIDLTQYE